MAKSASHAAPSPRKSRKTSSKPDPDQYERFLQTARQLGCDEDEETFQRALRKVATAPPVKRPTPPEKD
jgi:hypothetical protein